MKIFRLMALLVLLLCVKASIAQTKTITGVVNDEADGNPLQGVTIALKSNTNTNIATVSSASGNFSITVPSDGTATVLEFTFIGYLKKEIIVSPNEAALKVLLAKSTGNLDEVVVVGYGTQRKVNLSGSVNTIDKKAIVNRPVTSLTNALQGTVPGMAIISRPGDVGNDLGSINIRGRGNLGTSEPLYVVDGIIVPAGDFARINPNDVESISVLKDASASAIYGARAAYGVILVTTKKGGGAMRFNYNAYLGTQSAMYLPDFTSGYDYAVLRNEAETNRGGKPLYDATALDVIRTQSNPDLYPDNDWYALTLRKKAPVTQHELSVSGGDKIKYYLSGAYFLQNSLIPGKDLRRYSVRANTEAQVSKQFKIGSNISFIRDGFENEKGNIDFTSLSRLVPLMVARHSDGTWGSVMGGRQDALATGNTLRRLAEAGRSSYNTSRFIGSVSGNYTPIEGLDINGLFSYNFYNSQSNSFAKTMDPIIGFITKTPMAGTAVNVNQLDEQWQNVGRMLTQLTGGYSKKINLHDLKLLVGGSYENFHSRTIRVVRRNFPGNDLNAIDGGSKVPANTDAYGTISERAFQSVFGRFNYAFDNKYLLEASLRNDISSQFAPGHRGGIYPSASVAWRVSQESFMQNVSAVNELKLRLSAGKLGNVNNVGNYDFYDALATGTVVIIDQTKQDGVYPGKLPNALLTWEKIDMYNAGIDATLFKTLNIQLDVFNKLTKDILLANPNIPDESGLASGQAPSINVGKVRNAGYEFTAAYNGHVNDFRYTIGGNLSQVWNKVIDLGGIPEQAPSGYWINRVGEPIGSFYMYQSNGYYETDEEAKKQNSNARAGDIRYVDQNKDGVIDGDDRIIAGNDVPYFTYGVNLGANYKNFDFSVLTNGVKDVKVYLEGEAAQAFFNGAGVKKYVLDRWTIDNPNPNASYPRLSASGSVNFRNSDFWLFNADYFRIKSLSLGYTVPDPILERAPIKGLRVYVAANNPFTIRGDKRLKDFDPEVASQRSSYPSLKTYSFGINLTL